MKLHLPRTLVAALLACFSLHAQGETVYIDSLFSTRSSPPVDSDLVWNDDSSRELTWAATPGTSLSLRGEGMPMVRGYIWLACDGGGEGEQLASFTVQQVALWGQVSVGAGTELSIRDLVNAKGTIDMGGGSVVYDAFSVDTKRMCVYFSTGGGTFRINSSTGTYPKHIIITSDMDRYDNQATWDGNLRLQQGDQVDFYFREGVGGTTCGPLNVDGSLYITGAAEIECDYSTEGWQGKPAAILFTCDNVMGNVSQLTLNMNDDSLRYYTIKETAYGDGIALYVGNLEAALFNPPPAGEDVVIGNGSGDQWSYRADFDGSYTYNQGDIKNGTVYIGESGKVNFSQDLTMGGQAGAPADGASAAALNNYGELVVKGKLDQKYFSAILNRGSVQADEGITVGTSAKFHNATTGSVSGKAVAVDGTFHNDGKVDAPVTVNLLGTLQGAGSYEQAVTIASGATQRNGNSPGYNEYRAGLTYEDGAKAIFTVDGTTPVTSWGGNTEGHHSYTLVSGGTLTLGGTVNTTVEITAGILNAGTQPFTLTLLEVEGSGANVAGGGDFTLSTLDDSENLLLAGSASLVWDATNGRLLFSGTVDPTKAAQRMAPDATALANTLWSSTSAVRAFARNATTQLSAPAQVGKVTTWGSGLGDFVTMSGFRSQAYGYAAGADKQWCPHVRTGIALGQMFGDHTADRGRAEVEQESMMLGVYGEYKRELTKRHSLSATGYAAYGRVENDADTRLLGSNEVPGTASWDDDVFAAGFRAQWHLRVTEKTTLSPFIGLEYLRGEQGSFTEHYEGGTREYWGGAMQVWSLPAGVTAATELELGGGQKLLPWLTVGYVGDISRKDPHGSFRAYGLESRLHGTSPGRHGFMLNIGSHWQISDSWSAGASWNFETRSHETSHEGNFSVRYAF